MNADRIARAYRWIEYLAFGGALQRCRIAQLPHVNNPERVLILGEGDGRFLAKFLQQNPRSLVDVVEISQQMIALAQARIMPADRQRVRFLSAGALQTTYDLVVTNFFLDCLSQSDAERLIATLSSCRHWIVGEFQIPAMGFARLHATAWLRVMYLFFRLTTGLETECVPDYETSLRAAGYKLVNQYEQKFGLIVSQLWKLTDIH